MTGCAEIIEETASGADRARAELARLLGLLRATCWSWSVFERLQVTGAHLRSLSDLVDTTSPSGRLVVQVIGAIAEFERSLIAERTRGCVAWIRGASAIAPAMSAFRKWS